MTYYRLKIFIAILLLACLPCSLTDETTNQTTTTTPVPLNTTSSQTTLPINSTTNSTLNPSPVPKQCDCLNNGTCVNSTCKCSSGYYGSRCENVVCDLKTSQNDTLFAQQCLNGYCLRNTQTNQYECKCKPTHTGALCERPFCLDYCYNGGGCRDGFGNTYDFDIDSTAVANLTCLCPSGNRYYGARCEFDKCFEVTSTCPKSCWIDNNCNCNCNSSCDQSFCNKLGTCVLDSNEKLICKCSVGYSGTRCNIDNCVGYCFNNGTCSRDNETISCNCATGYNGTRCSNKINKDPPSTTQLPSKKSSTSSQLIYGLTITVVICLCLVGAYLLIQRGFFDNLNIDCFNRFRGYHNGNQSATQPDIHSGPSIVRTNLFFNKLEDEQSIIQNENL